MICYKDRTFCSSDCTNTKCFRYFSPEDAKHAEEMKLPIAWSDYSNVCPLYTTDKRLKNALED